MNTVTKRVREFYLRGYKPGSMPGGEMIKLWYAGGPEVDAQLRERFLDDVEAAAAGRYDELNQTAEGVVTNLILMDQFSRNIYRGTAGMFQNDAKALALAKHAVATGLDRGMDMVDRMFVYLPYEHAEDVETQNESVRLYSGLVDEVPEAQRPFAENLLKYAKEHRDPILKWGRFPHRNELLGRESNEEELAYLAGGGGFFADSNK